MDMEIMTDETDPDVNGWDGALFTGTEGYRYITPDDDGDSNASGSDMDHENNDRYVPNHEDFPTYGLWLARNHHYNHIYYNPAIEYEPWIGVDDAGNPYTKYTSANVSGVTTLRQFPYSAGSNTFNLTMTHSDTTDRPDTGANYTSNLYVPHYYVWDSANDALGTAGKIEKDDNKLRIDIKNTTSVCADGTSATEQQQYDNSCMLRSYNSEIANFANWWTYHRRREYVSKNGVSKVISSSTGIRMGMSNIHNVSTYEYENASMNSDVAAGNKQSLLNKIFSLQSDQSGTPLKSALDNSGKYFECDSSDATPLFSGSPACPIVSTIVSPATETAGVCQQNFTILVTDGFYKAESITTNDDNDSTETTQTNHNDGNAYTFSFDGNPYADTYANTLADIAMHYYERDLDTSLNNKIPTKCGVDENPMQHMVTYTLSMGLSGSLGDTTMPDHPQKGFEEKSDGTLKCPAETGTAFTWPEPITDNNDADYDARFLIDDLQHAAFNGRGLFAAANKPADMVTALEAAVNNAIDRTGSAAAVAFNSTTLSTNSAVYLALFESGAWSGDLEAYPLDANTGNVGSTRTWSAADVLDGETFSTTYRDILTYNTSASPPAGISFTWAVVNASSGINPTIKADLSVKPDGTTDTNAQARLNYIRGDRSNEGTGLNFRVRDSRLGDIVHSAPVYVGRPQLSWPEGDGDSIATTSNGWPEGNDNYSYFKNNNSSDSPAGKKDRSGVVYVGANDGMLHGFSEADGSEVMAYIPSYLFSTDTTEGLHHLADPAYSHRYFVDLSPTVTDVYIKTRSNSSKSWRTILVGANGGGGAGIFALDVTDPSALTEANATNVVLWEFTHPKLGKTFSRPVIVPTYLKDSNGHYRWAAIFGNGYNNTDDGKSSLFIVFLDGGLDGVWTDGSSSSALDYIVITTPEGSVANNDCSDASSDCNGMSSPAVVDLDSDYVVDKVYAGDVHGNMWAFEMASDSVSDWKIVHGNSNDEPLFTAKDPSNNRQPITSSIQVARHPTSPNNKDPNVLVMFGTGQYLVSGDASDTSLQTFYGVWDNDEGNNASGSKLRADLQPQTIEFQGSSGTGKTIRVISDTDVNWTHEEGWYLDLGYDSDGTVGLSGTELQGERVVTSPVLRGDIIFFNTTIPSPNPCSAGGSGWLMSLDYSNGGRPDAAIFDLNNDGVVDTGDLFDHDSNSTTDNVAPGSELFEPGMPASPSFLGNKQYTPGTKTTSGDEIDQRDVQDLGGYKTGRLSWQQLQ